MAAAPHPPLPMGLGSFLLALLRRLRPYRRTSLLILAGILVDLAFTTGLPLAFKLLIDGAVGSRDPDLLTLVVAALLGGMAIAAVAAVGRDWLYASLGARLLADLRLLLFTHVQRLSLGFFARTRSGDLMARFSS